MAVLTIPLQSQSSGTFVTSTIAIGSTWRSMSAVFDIPSTVMRTSTAAAVDVRLEYAPRSSPTAFKSLVTFGWRGSTRVPVPPRSSNTSPSLTLAYQARREEGVCRATITSRSSLTFSGTVTVL